MSTSVIAVKDFDISKISFGEIKKVGTGTGPKYVPIYYNKNSFKIQTPECYAPYGMNVYHDEKTGETSHSLSLSFRDKANRPTLEAWFETLNKLDQRVLEEVKKNSMTWLKKPADSVEHFGVKAIKYPLDENGEVIDKYPPTYQVKLKKDPSTKAHKCMFFNTSSEQLNPDDIIPKMKGGKVTSIVNISGVWIAGSKFGISMKADQLLVEPKGGNLTDFGFADIKEDKINGDEEKETDIVQVTNDVETSDDEEDAVENVEEDSEDSSEEDEPEPEPVVKKTTKGKAKK